jgi:hypothetical protein
LFTLFLKTLDLCLTKFKYQKFQLTNSSSMVQYIFKQDSNEFPNERKDFDKRTR